MDRAKIAQGEEAVAELQLGATDIFPVHQRKLVDLVLDGRRVPRALALDHSRENLDVEYPLRREWGFEEPPRARIGAEELGAALGVVNRRRKDGGRQHTEHSARAMSETAARDAAAEHAHARPHDQLHRWMGIEDGNEIGQRVEWRREVGIPESDVLCSRGGQGIENASTHRLGLSNMWAK